MTEHMQTNDDLQLDCGTEKTDAQKPLVGEHADLTLVFLHGWGMNGAIFERFCTKLKRQLDTESTQKVGVLVLDLPGYGNNLDAPVKTNRLDELVQMVAPQLPANSIVLGWSLGGLVAQWLAVKQCSNMVGLITMCSSPKFVKDEHWQGIDEQVLENFQQQLTQDSTRTLKRFLAIQNLGQANAKTEIQHMLKTLQTRALANASTLKLGLETLQQSDLRASINDIRMPTLRMYGRLDSLVPHKAVEPISTLQKDAETVIYPKASHAPFMSHPDAVIWDILAFLGKFKKD